MKSMTWTLVAANLIAFTLIQLIAGTLIYLFVSQGLTDQFDSSLDAKLDTVLHLPELEGVVAHGMRDDFDSRHAEIFTSVFDLDFKRVPEDQYYLQIYGDTKRIFYRSPTFEDKLPDEKQIELETEPIFDFCTLPNGNLGRTLHFRHRIFEEQTSSAEISEFPNELRFVLARDATELSHNLRLLRWTLILVGMVTLSVVAVMTFLMTKQGIRPLSSLADEIERLDEEDAFQRIETRVPIELCSIKNRLNEYVEKIELMFQRERQFSDDVAHELRTPLAGIMVKLEHALSSKRSDKERKQALVESRKIADQLDLLTRKLLELSRLETTSQMREVEEFDVAETLRLTWSSFEPTREDYRVKWDLDEQIINSDLTLFIQLMTNIFNNAQSYVDADGDIEINCTTDGANTKIEVSNTGSLLRQQDVSHVFSRLWRADKARVNSNGHLGLGLAIAQKIVKAIHGTISVDIDGTWFRVSVYLPNSFEKA